MPELLPQGKDGKDLTIKFQKYLILSIKPKDQTSLGEIGEFQVSVHY